MANSKYAGWVKEALISEVKARRTDGRQIPGDLRAGEDALRTMLDTDDVENGEFDAEADPTKPPVAADPTPDPRAAQQERQEQPKASSTAPIKLMSQLTPEKTSPATSTLPKEEEWEDAPHYKHKSDGYVYQVIRRASDPYDKPVKARVPAQNGHPGLMWEGTNDEFNTCFEKV